MTGADSAAPVGGVPDTTRLPLTRDRVLRAGVQLADGSGIEAVSMRRLGLELGVEAMSLYNHVANKGDLLDGMVEFVVGEIAARTTELEAPDPALDWQGALRARILAARQVMLEHRWMPVVLESRAALSPGVVRHYDGVLAALRAGGFSWDLAHHSLHALGSRALGFAQELFDPSGSGTDDEASRAALAAVAEQAPHLVEMLSQIAHVEGPESTLGWCDDQEEFEFGLDALLDGLERRRLRITSQEG